MYDRVRCDAIIRDSVSKTNATPNAVHLRARLSSRERQQCVTARKQCYITGVYIIYAVENYLNVIYNYRLLTNLKLRDSESIRLALATFDRYRIDVSSLHRYDFTSIPTSSE